MRLVDADALQRYLTSCLADCDGTELDGTYEDGLIDAKQAVDGQPTIDAIPVEWLRNKMEKMNHAAEPHFAFMYVLREWEKEQEAR